MNKTARTRRRYRLTGQEQGGGSGYYATEAVVEVKEGEEVPEGAKPVDDDTPLHDWRPVEV